ncbi:MAG TPA: ThuA domain-containing protein, partial [Verrucomicrobiae bacterium]|nr:ThuA domain-containing protein [Verrucomicrobiae bacterium]
VRLKRLKPAGAHRLVLVAGRPSHGPGEHEFNAGVKLIQKCLQGVAGLQVDAYYNGWPRDPSAFDEADGILFYMDGGKGHPVAQGDHLQIIGNLARKGVGVGFAHYAVEVANGAPAFVLLDLIGGYYEDGVSTNPHWIAEIEKLPKHPVTRGVQPFAVGDEWYFNIHFREGMTGITPILVAKPSDETRQGKSSSPRGPHPHIVAASGREEVLMWTTERPDGGRGFGFTGGHSHVNWGNDNFRKLFLNALLWISKIDPPADGVFSTVTQEELQENLDPKGRPARPAPVVNLSGDWQFNVETTVGKGEPVFTFQQTGDKLSGTYKGQLGEAPLTGLVKGNEAKWTFTVRMNEQDVLVSYAGKIDGPGKMSGKVQIGDAGDGTWTAKK